MMKPLHRSVVCCTWFALSIVAPSPVDAQEATVARDKDGFVETIERRYTVDPGVALTLEAETGSVQVDSWTNDEVEIHIQKRIEGRREDRARNAFEEIEVVLSRRDNNVHIRVVDNDESIFFRNRVTVEMNVRVPVSCTLDLTTVDGTIEIEEVMGPVTARTVDGNIEIRTAEGLVDASTTDGNVEIEEVTGSVTAHAVDGDIEIDSTRGQVMAGTTDGDIDIRNTLGTVAAKSVDGDIDIRHVTGDVSASTTDGDISIRGAQSAVTVDTVDGNIETDTTDGDIDADALEGNIHLFDARGSVNAQAIRGSIEVYVARTNRDTEQTEIDSQNTERDLETQRNLETTEGDVTIYLPEDLPATIEAEGSSGGLLLSRLWRNDLGHIDSDFGLNQSEWGVFFYVQSEASGDLIGGGDRIRLKTNSGNIYIKERSR